MSNETSITYKDAGVDTERAAALVDDIASLRAKTEGRHKLFSAFGLFAAGMDLSNYNQPVILCGCDGVGTKLELLLQHDLLETAGIDLVAMSVNDILTANAQPLMFLDYIGVDRLDEARITRLIAGMTDALAACGCVLAGGETAEMPGVVPEGMIELSGFCVGVAEKSDLLDPTSVQPGDLVVGFASDGIHANGFSLVRRLLAEHGDQFSEQEMRALLTPTRLYHDVVDAANDVSVFPRAMAHITGGGIRENLARVLGDCGANLQLPTWENPPVQKLISLISRETALHTFNMGIGWMIIVPPEFGHVAATALPGSCVLGEVTGGGDIDIEVMT